VVQVESPEVGQRQLEVTPYGVQVVN
jgi:hypothetical protein